MLDEKLLGRQTFDLQSDRLLLKEIIKKEFLAIEIWAINDDNPNNNYSHFVAEDYAKSLPSFVDKPILAYFAQGDFKAHEGKNAKDDEMDITYWDNSKGEQILGFIRAKDKVEIREKEGKQWIVTTAVLWSKYNYHQIKKIIKDKRKKVSVEIEVLDAYFTKLNGEELDAIELKSDKTLIVKNNEGKEERYKYGTYIQHITQFDLTGITILGSKMGIPIKEGIEGASLSILEEMGKALFSRQQQALTFAYQKLDGEDESVEANITFSKEDKGEMDNQDLSVEATVVESTPETFEQAQPEEVTDKGTTLDEPGDEVKMEGTQECKMTEGEAKVEDSDEDEDDDEHSEDECKYEGEEATECKLQQENQEQENSDADGHSENCAEEVCPECGKNPCECEAQKEENCKMEAEENTDEPANHDEDNCNNCKFEEGTNDDQSADGQPGDSEEDYASLLSKYNETKAALDECQAALAAQEKKYADQEEEMAKIKKDCDEYLGVKEQYAAELEELRKVVFVMVSDKRSEQAAELMSQNGLTQEQRTNFLTKCHNGEYNESYENLKRDIALAYFDYNNGTSAKRNSDVDFSVSLTPSKTSVNAPKSRAQKLADYANGR